MKTVLIFSVVALLFACNTTNDEKTISIMVKKDSDTSIDTIDNHKDKDFEIFRNKDSYSGSMFRMDKGKLREYKFFTTPIGNAGPIDYYDKATYKWINDSTITYKLINSSNNLSISYTIKASEYPPTVINK